MQPRNIGYSAMRACQVRFDGLLGTSLRRSDLLVEDLVHDLGAARQGRNDLMPVDQFVVAVWLCPASSAIASTGTPRADSSDTNVCRISRGTHSVPRPASSVIARNIRRTL